MGKKKKLHNWGNSQNLAQKLELTDLTISENRPTLVHTWANSTSHTSKYKTTKHFNVPQEFLGLKLV